MIELGLVMLVQADPSVAAIAAKGGFFAELPKNSALPSWTYRSVGQVSNTTLTTSAGLAMRRLQVDCYGEGLSGAADVIALAAAIDKVLNGYSGTLLDPDNTFVSSCFSADLMDFFDEERRSYRRMLEYEILYAQN